MAYIRGYQPRVIGFDQETVVRPFRHRSSAALLTLAVALAVAGAAQAQSQRTRSTANQIEEGHDLALMLCFIWHVAAPDQSGTPMMS